MKKEKEKVESQKDAATKSVLSDEDINKLVDDRAILLVDARSILGDKMPDCGNCPKEIKVAVVDEVLDMGDLSGKSDDYIDAAYDMAIKKVKKTKDSLDNLTGDFKKQSDKNKKTEDTREGSRDKYMKDHLGIEEV